MIDGEQEHAVRVLVDDGAHGPVQVLAQRIAQLAIVRARLRSHGNRLHPDGTERVGAIDQRQVVRRDAQAEDAARLHAPAPLVFRERHEFL